MEDSHGKVNPEKLPGSGLSARRIDPRDESFVGSQPDAVVDLLTDHPGVCSQDDPPGHVHMSRHDQHAAGSFSIRIPLR
jgi:hypothetical protein